jgi:excisionase family DNA binding protein
MDQDRRTGADAPIAYRRPRDGPVRLEKHLVMQQTSPDRLMTVDELAELLHQGPWMVYKSFKSVGIPYIKINGGSVRFRRSSVERWLDSQEEVGFEAKG